MSDSTRDLLVRGIAAAKAKDNEQARFYLEWVLRTDAAREQQIKAWLWLTEVSEDLAEKRDCLENVLVRDPTNALARRGLAILDGKLKREDIIDPDREKPQAPEMQSAPARRFVCPQCGGKLAGNRGGKVLHCQFCDRDMTLYQAIEEGAMVEESDFAVALATARGHTEPVDMHSFNCESCGASFMPGSGAMSLNCPYCSSAYVVQVAQTKSLIPPEGIIAFSTNQEAADDAFSAWLREKKLGSRAQTTDPSGLYLPAWTFDVGGELRWRGMVLERVTGSSTWMPRTGAYPIFYDDVLVPASHTLPARLMEVLETFELDRLQSYDPAHLADWPAEIYQISAAEASLAARRTVWEKGRRVAQTRISVESGKVTDLSLSSAGIVIEAFKLVLLPVWIACYRVEGEDYQAVINGQTGEVQAEAPRSGLLRWLGNII